MKTIARSALLLPLLLESLGLTTAAPAYSQSLDPSFAQAYARPGSQPARVGFRQAELDQMLAPVALYPDALLAQIFMASTYPRDVAEAARYSRSHPELVGDDAVRMADGWLWDPSVRSLLAFPQLLQLMDQRSDWAANLGEAFLIQPEQVIDTTQFLRQRAWAAGNLQSNETINVVRQGQTLMLESPDPQVIYIPYYDPNQIYGRWWWPAHQPVGWTAWPGFYAGPGASARFFRGRSVGLSNHFFVGAFDWQRRQVRVLGFHNHNAAVVVNGTGRRDRPQTVIASANAAARIEPGQRLAASSAPTAFGVVHARPPATVSAARLPAAAPASQIDSARIPSRDTALHAEHHSALIVPRHHSQSALPAVAPQVLAPSVAIAIPRTPAVRASTALPDPQRRAVAGDGLPRPGRHDGGR